MQKSASLRLLLSAWSMKRQESAERIRLKFKNAFAARLCHDRMSRRSTRNDPGVFLLLRIDKPPENEYYNYRYITTIIVLKGETEYAAQNKDYKGHDRSGCR